MLPTPGVPGSPPTDVANPSTQPFRVPRPGGPGPAADQLGNPAGPFAPNHFLNGVQVER